MFDKLIDKIRLINNQIAQEQDKIVLETQLDLLEIYTSKLVAAHNKTEAPKVSPVFEPIVQKKEEEQPIKNTFKPKPVTELPKEVIVEEKPVVEPIQETLKPVQKEGEPLSINERFSGEKPTIADKAQRETKNLKKLIDINERFSFINNLFEGDVLAYDKAIRTINNHTDYHEAMAYIRTELKHTYNWSLENSTVTRFLQLVRSLF